MFYSGEEGDIEEYLPYVYRVVNQLKGTTKSAVIDKDDLISVGVMGLIEAKNTYLPEKGSSFEKYAYGKIRFSILNELRRVGIVDFHDVIELRKMRQCEEALSQEKGRMPTDEEIRQRLGFNEKKLSKLNVSRNLLGTVSLESLIFETSWSEADGDRVVGAEYCEDALTKIERQERYDMLKQAISELNEQQQLILQLYYVEGLSFVAICDIINVSQSRMSQLHKKAIGDLRAIIERIEGGIR